MRTNTICCLLLAVYLTSAAASRAPADTLVLAQVGKGTSKTPKYSVKNSTDDFEVRLYEPSTWVTTVAGSLFGLDVASTLAFKELTAFFLGHNKNHTKIPLTSPFVEHFLPPHPPPPPPHRNDTDATPPLPEPQPLAEELPWKFFTDGSCSGQGWMTNGSHPHKNGSHPHPRPPPPPGHAVAAAAYIPEGYEVEPEDGPPPPPKNPKDSVDVDRPHPPGPPGPPPPRTRLVRLNETTVYARSFGGWAPSWRLFREARHFGEKLEAAGVEPRNGTFFAAFYDPTFKVFKRHNELWWIERPARKNRTELHMADLLPGGFNPFKL